MKFCRYFMKFACLLALLFTACSHFTNKQVTVSTRNIHEQDSIITHTGDTHLDSLLQAIISAPQDTSLARLYLEVGDIYEDNDFELAKYYYLKFENLSELLEWNEGRYLFACVFSSLLLREGYSDSALVILQNAYDLVLNDNDLESKANLVFTKGNAYFVKEWYETALSCYLEALSIYESINNDVKIQQLYYMISQLYQSIDIVEKAIEYGEKSVEMNWEDPAALAALAMAYSAAHEYEKAKKLYEKALSIVLLQNNIYMEGLIYFHIANDALFEFDLKRAEYYAGRSLEINRQFGAAIYFTDLILLSKLEQVKGNFFKSEEYVKEALQIAIELDAQKEKRLCYMILSELSIAQQKYRENIQYWEESNLIELAIARQTALRSAEEMDAKYDTEKKELKITALEKTKRLYIGLIFSVGVIFLLAIVTFFFILRLTMQKKRFADQKRQFAEQQLIQIEKEKQLVAAQAALDGENAERIRVAKDLHDGLGSLLSLVKFTLPNMKTGESVEAEDTERFAKARNMLDESINELRRVAHHLMPESLIRYGLKASLSDFCHSTELIRFYYFGNDQRLDGKLEIMLYRSAHELINNALKHADASQINVQLVQENDRVSLTVQDDGKGFSTSIKTNGMGINNIRNRVETYNGKMLIISSPESGTEVNIEIEI